MERLMGTVYGKGYSTRYVEFSGDLNYEFSPGEIAVREALSRACDEQYKRGWEIINANNAKKETQQKEVQATSDKIVPIEVNNAGQTENVVVFEDAAQY